MGLVKGGGSGYTWGFRYLISGFMLGRFFLFRFCVWGWLGAGTAVVPAASALAAGGSEEEPGWLIRTWDSDDGLPQNSVVSLAQTADGYIWAATLVGGVSRFDGVRFANFEPANTPQLVSPEGHLLFPAAEGSLLVAQNGGAVARWQEGRFTDDFTTATPDARRPAALLRDVAGETIFALQGGGVLWRPGAVAGERHWEVLRLPEAAGGAEPCIAWWAGRLYYRGQGGELRWWQDGETGVRALAPVPGNVLLCLAVDPSGRMWIGTDAGLGVLNAEGLADRTPPGGGAGVEQMEFCQDGGLWARGGGRLRRWQDGKWTAEAQGLPASVLAPTGARSDLELLPEADGSVWVLRRNEGVWHVRADGRVRALTAAEGLPGGPVECGLVDREGSLWLGFNGGGMARVRARFFEGLRDPAQPVPVVRSICEDSGGSLWMGHAGGRLLEWSGGKSRAWTLPLTAEESAKSGVVLREVTVWRGADGEVWAGSVGHGAWVRRGGEFVRPFPPEDIGTVVRAGLCDRAGRVWIGSERGLFMWSEGKVRGFKAQDGWRGGYVLSLAEGPDGAIWAGTADGQLWRWKDGSLVRSTKENSGRFRFWALHAAADGTVWIGSLTGGLFRWKDGKLARFTKGDGLPSDTITQILSDGMGLLWMGSREGIFSVPEQGLHRFLDGGGPPPHCRLFSKSDGLPAMECSGGFHPACLAAADGRLWFATVKGAVAVRPERLPGQAPAPAVMIEEALVNGSPNAEPVPALTAAGRPLTLPPGDYSLDFRFTSTSLSAPEKLRFRWRLAGLEKDWVAGGTSRTARYGFLPPGSYEFQVIAGNHDGVWSAGEARLAVVVYPHYWQTLWFRISLPLGVITLGAWGVLAALRQRHRRQLLELGRRQALAAERARIARDLHDDLGASLTQLTWLCETAGRGGFTGETERASLTEIGARSRSMVRSIDAIVWAVNPRNDTVDQLAHYICQFAEDFLRGTAVRCRLDVDDLLPDCPLDATVRHEAFLIAREAIHNAARHSGADELFIRIHVSAGRVEITIVDNGVGFDLTKSGAGDGLRNMQSRADALGTALKLISHPGEGCTVRLSLPLSARNAPERTKGP